MAALISGDNVSALQDMHLMSALIQYMTCQGLDDD